MGTNDLKGNPYLPTTRRHIPEDSHLHDYGREDIRSRNHIFSHGSVEPFSVNAVLWVVPHLVTL